jgi:pyruvate dehydrogenase E2 component (dihydrolipoamide acetyltransferase)
VAEEIRIPDIGDADHVEVIELVAEPGATISKDDPLIVIESDKASMDVPSPIAGKLVRFEVAVGDEVETGHLIAIIEPDGGAGDDETDKSRADSDKKAHDDDKDTAKESAEAAPEAEKQPEKAERKGNKREKDKQEQDEQEQDEQDEPEQDEQEKPPARDKRTEREAGTTDTAAGEESADDEARIYAGPAVRRFARELGVDLRNVRGSGDKGRIVKDDVAAHVKSAMTGAAPETGGGTAIPRVPVPDFSKFGAIENVDRSRILLRGAENLARSWLNVPHVTHHDDADVTDLEAFRASLKAEAERRNVKLTPLPFVIKSVIAALRQFPALNASLSANGKQLIVKRYYHIGIAVDTDKGLVVPVVRDADKKGIFDLAGELADISDRARAGKLKSEEMQGASFTITSLGALGGRGFTPIINAPEVAILGVSKIDTQPVWDGSAFVPRQLMPLSLSYDHRVINGADAGRFMVYLRQAVSDLRRTLL